MKSDDRHKLKANELADSLGDVPAFLREYGSRIGIVAVLALVIVLGLWQWVANARAQKYKQISTLQNIMIDREKSQKQAVEQARLEADKDKDDAQQPLDTSVVSGSELAMQLSQLAAKTSDSSVGMMATLQEAQAIWSQMFFSTKPLSDEETEQLCAQAEKVYQQLQSKYSDKPIAVASAQIGLGLVAENRGQWDQACQIYQKITADETLAGTVFPKQAQNRLDIMDDIKRPIVFSEEPPAVPAEEPAVPAAELAVPVEEPAAQQEIPAEPTAPSPDQPTTSDKAETTPQK